MLNFDSDERFGRAVHGHAEMADGIRQRDPELIELSIGPAASMYGLCASGRFHDSANWRGVTGIMIPGLLLFVLPSAGPRAHPERAPMSPPSFSVIIPAYNACGDNIPCHRIRSGSGFSRRGRIIVVDDGSTDSKAAKRMPLVPKKIFDPAECRRVCSSKCGCALLQPVTGSLFWMPDDWFSRSSELACPIDPT